MAEPDMMVGQAASLAPLLARKGLAVPAGLPEPDDASPPSRTRAEAGQEAAEAAAAPAPAPRQKPQATPDRDAEPAPVASLLPDDYLGSVERSSDAAPPVDSDPPIDPAPRTEPEVVVEEVAPRADPNWRIGVTQAPAAARGGRGLSPLTLVLAIAAFIVAGWYAYQAGWLGTEARTSDVADSKTADSKTADSKTADSKTADSKTAATAVEKPAETPASADTPAEPASGKPAVAELPAAPVSDTAQAGHTTEDIPPSIDVARVEPNGAAVIAGRAAPGAELIVLDNGAPIGAVTADAFGEWVFIPASPLPTGAHDFGLVVKKVQGGVTLPAIDDARPPVEAPIPKATDRDSPGSERRSDAGGVQPGAAGPGFVVQLASLKTRDRAKREWLKLRRRFPKFLADMKFNLNEATLAAGVNVVRLRTGAFAKHRAAAALCKRLEAMRQSCLVVRTSAGG